MSVKKQTVKVYEMTCGSCENAVERSIKKLKGVSNSKASYKKEQVSVEYNDGECSLAEIKDAIKKAGYSLEAPKDYRFIGILLILAVILLLNLQARGIDMNGMLQNASYGVLFIIGLFTSIHCVGMCGGIMLSQSLTIGSKNNKEALKPSILYNAGRVIAYTLLGSVIGAVGSVFSLSIMAQAGIQILAGFFMIIMGFNLAGFKLFRGINLKLPKSSCKEKDNGKSPFIVGLLNGFMPCGPLQTMQLFALGTGSAVQGALSMFIFALGTVPLMLVFGALSSFLSKGYTKKILKVSGVLVIVLGLIMGNRGFALAGININPLTAIAQELMPGSNSDNVDENVAKAIIENGVQTIRVTADNRGYSPSTVYVQKGIPVKWIIEGKELNSCNNAIVANSIELQLRLEKGDNIVEFTPGDKDINYSCWMGMIRGVIKVVDDLGSEELVADPSVGGSTRDSCCAIPSSGEAPIEDNTSIYGNDISIIPTEVIVNKAALSQNEFIGSFQAIGYDLKPLILVSESSAPTKVTMDLQGSKFGTGEFTIIDSVTGEVVYTFQGDLNIKELQLPSLKAGGYLIIKDSALIGVIEIVDSLEAADLDEIRYKYID
ncbi:sulfite exporter TauE/SafE family protein [Alloiococcus sp. CFN-8]|uniref:urease accessory protein UreH domain-containing protein n=1 Tax=Alloiococcus sp. CFN-8 TaxID=3416081 RepID=UPI003CFB8554